MITEEKPSTTAVTHRRPRRIGRPLAIIAITALLIFAAVYYFWWRPTQMESALEDASIADLKKITAADPGNARAFYYLGKRIEQAGYKKDPLAGERAANVELERAIKLAPDDEQIWIEAAGTANGANGPAASFRVFDDFIKRHPRAKMINEERSSLLVSLQRAAEGYGGKAALPSDAITYYGLWLNEDPKAANAQEGLLKVLNAADSKTKGLHDGWLTLAKVYDLQGDKDKAQEARKKAEQGAEAESSRNNVIKDTHVK